MASTYRLLLNGTPATEDLYQRTSVLEVEENADMPGALQMTVSIARSEDGDLTSVNDAGFQPFANVAVVATAEGQPDECIFDGYVLAHKLHLQPGLVSSTLDIWAQDASSLMKLEEKTREWANVTDSAAANNIFGEYGFSPAPENSDEDSSAYVDTANTLMQRSSDYDFLRGLARRAGKMFRVACGNVPGQQIGYFSKPSTDADPVTTMAPNDPEGSNVGALDIEWDVLRPTAVQARQAVLSDSTPEGASGDADASGLSPVDERDLSTFAGRPVKAMLTTPADDGTQLAMRAQAVLRDAGWFVRCTGEADVSRLQTVLRVGKVISLDGVGSVHSGKYFVWSVRHSISADAHKMRFVLVRNAVGPAPTGGGGLGGLLP